jgi:hypothetical protein
MAVPERSNLEIINIEYHRDRFIPIKRTVKLNIGIRNDNTGVLQHSLKPGANNQCSNSGFSHI